MRSALLSPLLTALLAFHLLTPIPSLANSCIRHALDTATGPSRFSVFLDEASRELLLQSHKDRLKVPASAKLLNMVGGKQTRIGQKIKTSKGDFKVQGYLGCGSEGCVYLVVDERGTQQILKKIHASIEPEEWEDSVQGLGKLSRHGIPRASFDASLADEGILLFPYRPAVPVDEFEHLAGLDPEVRKAVEAVFDAIKKQAKESPAIEAVQDHNFAVDLETGQVFCFDFQ